MFRNIKDGIKRVVKNFNCEIMETHDWEYVLKRASFTRNGNKVSVRNIMFRQCKNKDCNKKQMENYNGRNDNFAWLTVKSIQDIVVELEY